MSRTSRAARRPNERAPRPAAAPRTPGAVRRAIPTPSADDLRVARVLTATLAALLAARACLAFVPSMWVWSLNLQRFLNPALGWGAWLLAGVALLPAVSRRLSRGAARVGDVVARPGLLAPTAAAVALAALVWLMPDRVWFVGDFLLRLGTVDVGGEPARLFPQALPLDVLLHATLPAWLARAGLADAHTAPRMLGAIEAALLGVLAVRFARVLALEGGAALAASATLAFGGFLTMFTGFGKAFSELCLLVAWAAVSGLDVVRNGRSPMGLGLVVAFGAVLHRSALGIVPAAVLAIGLSRRAAAGSPSRRVLAWAGYAVAIVTLAIMVPRIVAIVRRWDVVHFQPGAMPGGGWTAERAADLLNVLVVLSPLALVAAVLAVAVRPVRAPGLSSEDGAAREFAVLATLAAPFVLVAPFLHPVQGMFRDWDDFAATGVAVSAIAAWTLGRAFASRPALAGLALATAVSAFVPAVQWLGVNADLGRGMERVRAFVVDPPTRTATERGQTWDYLGIRHIRRARDFEANRDVAAARSEYALATEALGHAAETAPSPRIERERAFAALGSGDTLLALHVLRGLTQRDGTDPLVWLGYAGFAARVGDLGEARKAAERALALSPDNLDALRLLGTIRAIEAQRTVR